MKLRCVYSILLSCLLLALPLTSVTSYSQSQDAITESQVLAIVNSVDKAARKGNIAGIVAHLAKDVKIKMVVINPVNATEEEFKFTKEEYTFHTRRGIRQRLAYELERRNTRVTISDDGKTAMVTGDLYESVTQTEGTIRAVSSEVTILSLRDGKIVVTSVDSRTRFY